MAKLGVYPGVSGVEGWLVSVCWALDSVSCSVSVVVCSSGVVVCFEAALSSGSDSVLGVLASICIFSAIG